MSKNNHITINFKHYFNSFISQDFFIWEKKDPNNPNNYLIPQIDQNNYQLFTTKNHARNHFNVEEEDNEEEEENNFLYDILNNLNDEGFTFWKDLKTNNKILKNDSSNRSNILIYSNVQKQILDFLLKNELKNPEKNKIGFMPQAKKVNELKEIFFNYYNNDKIDYIINPAVIFEYKDNNKIKANDNFFIKANFFALDKKNMTAYLVKYKNSNEIKDYLWANFIYEISLLTNVKINQIKMILFDNNNEEILKNKLNLTITQAANISKNKKTIDTKKTDYSYQELLQIKKINNLVNNGKIFDNLVSLNLHNKNLTFMDAIYHNSPFNSIKRKRKNNKTDYPVFYFSNDQIFNEKGEFGDFKSHIDKIINGYYLDKPIYSNINSQLDLKYDYHEVYGSNKNLLKEIRSLHLDSKYEFAANVENLRTQLDFNHIEKYKYKVDQLRKRANYFTQDAINELSKYLKANKRYIWYDYEGVSSVTPIIDGVNSYLQITNQVSIIETINGQIIKHNNNIALNIVKDPKTISLIDIVDNILSVYSNKADYYVVFNKNYENTRNNEILKLVLNKFENNDKNFILQLKERAIENSLDFEKIINHINFNTLDLMDFLNSTEQNINYIFPFDLINYQKRNINDIDNIFLNENNTLNKFIKTPLEFVNNNKIERFFIFELFGKKSIKKIEKLINFNQFNDLEYSEYFKEYADLDVKNGSMAMKIAIDRYLNVIEDQEWIEKEIKLKEYCQNDVIAMLVTFAFFKKIILKTFPEINNYAYNFENGYLFFDEQTKKIKLSIEGKNEN
ncbi:DUF2779 domain-containing protein [Mycoplasma sp. 744]|uniref:UU173 family protein n=1 Tax=Mycoplasma sp. 744 TaxID=3108531 RepID=UPI002B1DF516|nr:DUF2779 domain-containing protein [Mycoplasma sp. 744]MEA4115499.1 DUF2779 domain-containing protein [Mycoplasma sp. 744]